MVREAGKNFVGSLAAGATVLWAGADESESDLALGVANQLMEVLPAPAGPADESSDNFSVGLSPPGGPPVRPRPTTGE